MLNFLFYFTSKQNEQYLQEKSLYIKKMTFLCQLHNFVPPLAKAHRMNTAVHSNL